MMPDMSCGDHPMWDYDNAKEYEQEAQQIDGAQQEIQSLKNQIMSLQMRIQADELAALMEKVVRNENPTVKDAWEKYQTVLRLSKK